MNNERLAEVWRDDIAQAIIIWPLLWKHAPRGDWFVSHVFWEIS